MPRSCLGFARGRAEPAPPRGASLGGRPCGGNPGTARKAVFSEGRGLRARVGRPHASPGYRMITEERTSGRWPKREMLRSSASLSRGRAEPAPPRGASLAERPWEENPGIMWRAVFSEGRTLCARVARPDASRGMASLRSSLSPRQPNPHLFSTLGRPLRYI